MELNERHGLPVRRDLCAPALCADERSFEINFLVTAHPDMAFFIIDRHTTGTRPHHLGSATLADCQRRCAASRALKPSVL